MDKCIHDDEKICMSEPEHDCQHCSIAGRRLFQDMSLAEQDDFWQDNKESKQQIKRNPVSGFRHVHGRAFIEAFDKAYKLK